MYIHLKPRNKVVIRGTRTGAAAPSLSAVALALCVTKMQTRQLPSSASLRLKTQPALRRPWPHCPRRYPSINSSRRRAPPGQKRALPRARKQPRLDSLPPPWTSQGKRQRRDRCEQRGFVDSPSLRLGRSRRSRRPLCDFRAFEACLPQLCCFAS